MQVTDKLTKALTEAKYLNADNVSRYRCIMRIFFENYEKLKYWLYQEEIYDQMKEDPFFAGSMPIGFMMFPAMNPVPESISRRQKSPPALQNDYD